MSAFSGFEPEVGEIRAVRTFRVGPGGILFPLFSRTAWTAGTNEARCNLGETGAHAAPDPECTCGFYAYADEVSARDSPFARYVLAVVACWGRVIAGTRGLRAQYARIEAIWLSPDVPDDLGALVRDRYPGAVPYQDRAAMLADHPATALDTYEPDEPPVGLRARFGVRSLILGALVAGSVPRRWIDGLPYGWWLWTATLGALVFAGLDLGRRSPTAARQRRRLFCFAALLWMVAPLAGAAGAVLLRLPLMQVAALIVTQRVAMTRLAATFPAPI